MKRFDLYGSFAMSTEHVAQSLQSRLAQQFVEHDSGYRGIYFRLVSEGEELLVQANAEDDEGYLLEPEFGRWSTLVYINGSQRWSDLEQACAAVGLDLLRSETL
jgi:hypothetical protein